MSACVQVLIFYLLHMSNSISTHPLLLVISLDGFSAGYLKEYKDVTPNLHEIANSGVISPWMETVFITKTLPNHHSIATGLYSESHGIVDNSFYDPIENDFFTSNSTDSKWWDTGSIPIWILNQLADENRKSGGMMWPGVQAIIKNQSTFYSVPYYQKLNNTILTEELNILTDEIISWMINDTNPANLVMYYIPEPDLIGHTYGPYSLELKDTLYQLDQSIGYLKNKLIEVDLYSKLNIIIVSDHGMAEVTSERIIFLDLILNHSYTLLGSSPALLVYPEPGQEDFVYETFRNASIYYNNTIKIYKKEDIPIEFHYKNNHRIPPYLLVAEEGYDIWPTRNVNDTIETYGSHGYNNSAQSMHALFIAHGPAFKSGIVVPPIRNIDLYPLMCHILDLSPEKNNGSLARSMTFLKYPPDELLHLNNN